MLNLIYIALGVFALAMILSPSFRNKVLVTLRIRANDVLDKSTTPLEREKTSTSSSWRSCRLSAPPSPV